MSDNFRKLRAILMGEVGKQIRLKSAEIPVAKVRRGRPRKGPRVVVRADRGGEHGIAYLIRADGKKLSLGVAGNDCEAAVIAAEQEMNVEYARMLGETSPMFTPLADVFEYEKSKIAPGQDATVADHRAFQSRAMKLDRLLGFYGEGATIGDVTPDACEEYGEWLLAQRARPNTKYTGLMTVGTLRMDLAWGRRALTRWAKRKQKTIINGFEVPPRPSPRQNWLTRSQVARICQSVLWGWIWDDSRGSWEVENIADPETGKVRRRRKTDPSYRRADVRARARQMVRAIMIMFYTGTRSGRVKDLLWSESPYCGWIDVDRGRICRSGMLVGKFAGPDKPVKPAGSSVIPEPLWRLARRWRRADRRAGHLAVVHKANGECVGEHTLYDLIKAAAVRSGMSDMVVHEFRHSCVTHCLRAGCTVAETAKFVDMSEQMVRTVYGHVEHEGTEKGAIAMADKSHQPEFTSRQLRRMQPRSMMRPSELMSSRHMAMKPQPGGAALH